MRTAFITILLGFGAVGTHAYGQQVFMEGFPADGQGANSVASLSWEMVMMVTAIIFLLWVFGILYLYGRNPFGQMRRWFFPHRVTGLFLRTDVDVLGPVHHTAKAVTQRKSHVTGYLTSLSENSAKFISDEKIPIGSAVHMRLTALPDYLGADKSVHGVVRSSQKHTSRGSFYETKVDVQSVPEENRDGFIELLDTLESNYTAA